jgi:hypothetical protein
MSSSSYQGQAPFQEPKTKIPNYPSVGQDCRDVKSRPEVELQCPALGRPPELEHGTRSWRLEEVEGRREQVVQLTGHQKEGPAEIEPQTKDGVRILFDSSKGDQIYLALS